MALTSRGPSANRLRGGVRNPGWPGAQSARLTVVQSSAEKGRPAVDGFFERRSVLSRSQQDQLASALRPGPRLRRWATRMASAATVIALTVYLQSFFDAPPLQPLWFGVWFATFPLAFMAALAAFLVVLSTTNRFSSLGRTVSWWSLIWRLLLGLTLVAVFATSEPGPATTPAGQPVVVDGRYFVDNHGTRTEVSEDEYVAISASWSRSFASAELLMAGAALLVLSGPWGRKDRSRRASPDTCP